MAAQKQDDQLERTFSSYVRIQAVVLKTYLGRWTIGKSGERGSGISVLPARYDDDDCQTNHKSKNEIPGLLSVSLNVKREISYFMKEIRKQFASRKNKARRKFDHPSQKKNSHSPKSLQWTSQFKGVILHTLIGLQITESFVLVTLAEENITEHAQNSL